MSSLAAAVAAIEELGSPDFGREHNGPIELPQQIEQVEARQVEQRRGIGDDDHDPASESTRVDVGHLSMKVLHVDVEHGDVMFPAELKEGNPPQPEQPPAFAGSDLTATEGVENCERAQVHGKVRERTPARDGGR